MFSQISNLFSNITRKFRVSSSAIFRNARIFPDEYTESNNLETPSITPIPSPRDDEFAIQYYDDNLDNLEKGYIQVLIK